MNKFRGRIVIDGELGAGSVSVSIVEESLLRISFGIIEQHQGSLRVRSVPGEGSCFTVCLPLANSSFERSQ